MIMDEEALFELRNKYDEVDDFHNGFARIRHNFKYGVINEQGIEILPSKYDELWILGSGFIKICDYIVNKDSPYLGDIIYPNARYGLFNMQGIEIIPPKYSCLRIESEYGFIVVELDGKYGITSEQGFEIIPLKYDKIGNYFINGLIEVKLNGKYGFINERLIEVVPPKYDSVMFCNGYVKVELNGKYGIVNAQGDEIVKPIFLDSQPLNSSEFVNDLLKLIAPEKSKTLLRQLTEKKANEQKTQTDTIEKLNESLSSRVIANIDGTTTTVADTDEIDGSADNTDDVTV